MINIVRTDDAQLILMLLAELLLLVRERIRMGEKKLNLLSNSVLMPNMFPSNSKLD